MKRNCGILALAMAAAVSVFGGEVRRVEGGQSTHVKGTVERPGPGGSKTTTTNIEKVVTTPGKPVEAPKPKPKDPIEVKKEPRASGTSGPKKDPKPGNLSSVFNGTAKPAPVAKEKPAAKPKS
jgi:hypothetical protein